MQNNRKSFNFIYFSVSAMLFLVAVCFMFILPKSNDGQNLGANYASELSFTSGTGSSSNPYIISNADQLSELAYNVNTLHNTYEDKYFELNADIDLSGISSWKPIGNDDYNFQGNFNGNGHRITGLKYLSTSTSATSSVAYGGLFGYIYGSVIKNLTIAGGSISSYYAGALAGYSLTSTITNCQSVDVDIDGIRYAGGLVGYSYSTTFSKCVNTSDVTMTRTGTSSSGYSGGIVGYGLTSSVSVSYNSGSIYAYQSSYDNSQSLYAGGIAGSFGAGSISECYNLGYIRAGYNTSTSTSYAGGITGYGGSISNSGNSGSIYAYSEQETSQTDLNGDPIVAFNNGAQPYYYRLEPNWKVSNANILYTYTTNAYAGGISGYTTYSPSYCYNVGSISGGKQTVNCTFTFVFYCLDASSISAENWEGVFEASKVVFSYTSKYYYSPINGNTNLNNTNCYGNASYDLNIGGNFQNYSDIKQVHNVSPWYKFYYNNNWDSAESFSTSSTKTTTFDDANGFTAVDDSLRTKFITTKNGDTMKYSINLRYFWREGKNDEGYKEVTLYSNSYNNTVKFSSKNNTQLSNLINSGLSSTYWAKNSLMNNGYPFPKNLMWSANAQSF